MIKVVLPAVAAGLISTSVLAADIKLPEPDKSETASLMQALEARHSDRAFADKDISLQELSTVLWAAYGTNRPDGKRTIPTAMNEKDLSVYVFNKDGIYLYDADENLLKQISDKNQLSLFQKQDYMTNVPVVLVYVGSGEDYAAMHAGSAYQNVGLYAAAHNMANIVRGYFDRDGVAKALKLGKNQRVIISQAIGWPEK